jgi:hypothetical protein
MKQIQIPAGMGWDSASPFFRQALRDGDPSAHLALHNAIEQGLSVLDCGLVDEKQRLEACFMRLINQPSIIENDQDLMARETDQRLMATEKAQIDVLQKKMEARQERIDQRTEEEDEDEREMTA